MGAKDPKDTPKADRTGARSASSPTAKQPKTAETAPTAESTPSDARFVADVETRGEAAKPNPAGKLPLNATHVVVEENPDGTAKRIERARFKAF
jgi:hypothetical protein